MKRIGLIGGLSWESTALYYELLNRLTAEREGAWHQPLVIIDSVDFAQIVAYQRAGDWESATAAMVDAAKRLVQGGATVLGICANTMHISYEAVASAVDVPVIDVREAIADETQRLGASSLTLLGTKYVMEGSFYSSAIERAGIKVVTPLPGEIDEVQSMIYDELTQGIINETSRERFMAIAASARERGGEVVGLCCTEFGMYVDEENAPFPFIDSTRAHVEALLRF